MISTESDNDRSAVYLDQREARRLANAEFSIQSYEYQKARLESFEHETTLSEVIHRSKFFNQPSGKFGWSNMEPGASR